MCPRAACAVPLPVLDVGVRHPLLPVVGVEFVAHHLLAVEPVLDGVAAGHDPAAVPVPDRPGRVLRRRVQGVVRPVRVRVVGPEGAVADLVLGGVLVDVLGVLGGPVEDAAVAAVRHLPVERQLEVAELLLGDQVAGLLDPDQRPVDRLPAGRDALLLVAPPALRRGAVEQQPPAVGLLLLGQGVGRRLGHRPAELGGDLLDRPQPDVPVEDLGPLRLELDAAAGDRLLLAVHLAGGCS